MIKNLFRAALCALVAISALVSPSMAQERVAKLYEILAAAGHLPSSGRPDTLGSLAPDGKCGLRVSFEIWRHWTAFSPAQKERITSLMEPPQLDTSRVVGRFRIFYDTTGNNLPALLDSLGGRIPGSAEAYVDSVGKCFTDAWAYEVDSLGYPAPPLLQGETEYAIYIQDLGGLLYGDTQFWPVEPIDQSIPPRYTTFIRVDNDYQGFYSEGIAGLKVTSAHEFHHAIQLGNYGFWEDDQYFYEITSTWMETAVHPEVKDYYQYIKTATVPVQPRGQFEYPDVSFTSMNNLMPYSRAIWGKFIEKRFSRDLMRQTWEYIPQSRPISALDRALTARGSSFRQAFVEWALWNYRTAGRSDTVQYYTDGRDYPPISMRAPVTYSWTPRSFADSIEAISSSYRGVCLLPTGAGDCNTSPQMIVIVSNLWTDAPAGYQRYQFLYDMTPAGGPGYKSLANGVFVRLSVPDPANWVSQESVPEIVPDVIVYPDPFMLSEHKPLNFKLPPTGQATVTLSVFSFSMDRMFSGDLSVVPGESRIQWDGHNDRGDLIPTGVYVFVISTEDNQYVGKFAVVKE